MNLYDSFFSRGAPEDHRPAITTLSGERYSYADLDRRCGQMANLLAGIGVRRGDRVAAQIEKSVDAIILYLATIRVGAVFLPLNTAYTRHEVGYFVSDATPAVLVCAPARVADFAEMAAHNGARLLTMGALGEGSLRDASAPQSDVFETVDRRPDDLAAILYTSGTTGRSKGAMLTHENLRSNALALKEIWRFTADDVLIHALPIYHLHGLFAATNCLFAARSSMIFLPKFSADDFFEALPRATTFMGVPTFYTRLLQDERLDAEAVSHMRLFVSGSAPLLAETHREWSRRTGHRILERYGMTETSMITSNPYDGERIAGTVGFPLPGVTIRIADPETGAPVAAGGVGMVEIRGPNVFKGYWQMPEKTQSEFRPDGFFVSGDLGTIDENGYLSIVGRAKDLIITGGYNVYPKEVEVEIDGLDGVEESAVIGLPHADFGEAVTAVIVPKPGAEIEPDRLVAILKSRLAGYKVPKRIVVQDSLPRNAMGKVQKNSLREQFSDLYRQ